MFTSVELVLLWVLAIAVRLLGNRLHSHGRWHRWWWALILCGAILLIMATCYHDLRKVHWNSAWDLVIFVVVPCAMMFVCWLGVGRHIVEIHAFGSQSMRQRTIMDSVMDICLYPIVLSILAGHSVLVLLTGKGSLDASTSLEASGLFESWALASVLTLFESRPHDKGFVEVHATTLGVYQFLVVTAGLSGVSFFLKGLAPCHVCVSLGSASCGTLARLVERITPSELLQLLSPTVQAASEKRKLPSVMAWFVNQSVRDILIFGSSSLALSVLFRAATTAKAGQSPLVDSERKLLGVKLIVSVLFFQPLGLRYAIPAHDVELAHVWLLCIEAFLLHLFHRHFAYPSRDFQQGGVFAIGADYAKSDLALNTVPELVSYGASQAAIVQQMNGKVVVIGANAHIRTTGKDDSFRTVSWREILVLALLAIFLLTGWAHLSASFNILASCSTSVINGQLSMAFDTFHECDVATMTCNEGYAVDSHGIRTASVTCGAGEHVFLEGHNATAGCSTCAVGRVSYPDCIQCNDARHCNGHAASVSDDGIRASCVCECRAGWAGQNCGECAPGHIGYPLCSQCSIASHCNNHASAVHDDGSRTSCKCTCAHGWTGDTCNMPMTKSGCTCRTSWESCSFLGGCTEYSGCTSSWFGNWCQTVAGCKDSWDYC